MLLFEKWAWHILFPLAPGICLLRRRLLYFLWRLRVFTVWTACPGSVVNCAVGWPAGVDCAGGSDADDSESVLSVLSAKMKSSVLALQLRSADESLLDEASLWEESSVTTSFCVLNFSISSVRAEKSDHGCRESWEVENVSEWIGVPGEEGGDGTLLGGSSWSLAVSKCRTGGAALESNLERRAEITA